MDIPDDVKQEYKQCKKVSPDEWVDIKVQKGMYGLPQAGLLAQELLVKRFATHEYAQSKLTTKHVNS